MSTTRAMRPTEPSVLQNASSPSVKVFWLDIAQVRMRLRDAALQLARAHAEIREIWLFGSIARGDAGPGSDADLLIIVDETPLAFLDRSVFYQPPYCGLSVDVLVYTESERAQMQCRENCLMSRVRSEGICLVRHNDE